MRSVTLGVTLGAQDDERRGGASGGGAPGGAPVSLVFPGTQGDRHAVLTSALCPIDRS